ncbi:MAG: hypothetical protein WC201_00410 [Bacilli bacterium]
MNKLILLEGSIDTSKVLAGKVFSKLLQSSIYIEENWVGKTSFLS